MAGRMLIPRVQADALFRLAPKLSQRVAAFLVALISFAPPAAADWLVTRAGTRIETEERGKSGIGWWSLHCLPDTPLPCDYRK